MKRKETIRFIAGIGVLAALTVVLTLIVIPVAGIPLNLALMSIALAAILYGPWGGIFVGVVNGGFVMLGAGSFFAINPVGTVIVCLLKSGLAGLVAALIFKWLQKKNEHVAVIVATISVPIVNTTVFIIGSLIFFNGAFGQLITTFVTLNFFVEFAINLLLSPSIYYIVRIVKKKYSK